mgnify:CR=1 FL=1
MDKRYYTIQETCEIMEISRNTARTLAEKHNAIRRIGPRLIRVDMPALMRAMDAEAKKEREQKQSM